MGRVSVLAFAALFVCGARAHGAVTVGSKIFAESYVLGEIAAQSIEAAGPEPVKRKLGMGATGMLVEGIKAGAIDVYPDYVGTLIETVAKDPRLKGVEDLRRALAPMGLTISNSLGFSNVYALAVKESFARERGLRTIGDLVRIAPDVRAAFSYEFMDRADGYGGLVQAYGLKFAPERVSRMEHALVYGAIEQGAVDVIEVYSTDANVEKLGLRTLKDDRGYFRNYDAVWVARADFVAAHPREWSALRRHEGAIDERRMRGMNAEAEIDKTSFAKIAAGFLGGSRGGEDGREGLVAQILERTNEHLRLVGAALLFSVCVGIPLGVFAAARPAAGQAILLVSALVQTIPALALLAFLIPLMGVGAKPALAALCLYGLLPIVVNTSSGLRAIDSKMAENAKAFGLTRAQILLRVTLPLASPAILSGVRTSAIVSVGTATLAALVGAGGYGAPIVSGLSLNDTPTILTGAVPAALMALLAHGAFELIEIWLVPKALRESGPPT